MTVSALVSAAQGYATSTLSQASGAMGAAQSLVGQVGFTIPNFTPVTLPNAPPSGITVTLPTLTDVTLDLPTEPTDPLLFQDIPALELGVAPVLSATAPTVSLPTKPSALAEFVESAPALNTNLAFPEPPSELLNPLISAPTLTERTEPTKPQVLLPSFTAEAPTGMPAAPTDHKEQFQAAYQGAAPSFIAMLDGQVDAMLAKFNPRYAEQMGRIETQLATYLQGGTGLAPAVENAIYERARSKSSADIRRVSDAAYSEAATRGFTLPTGALMASLQTARQAGADNNAAAAREIVVMQAEMEQKNLQFAVSTSANLRQTMLSAALGYHQSLININGQALDYAKTTLSAVIEVYNTAVKAFGLKLEAYRADAAVYETRLKAALAGIELYKAEVDALQALTNVDRAKVEVYKARIDTLNVFANVYRAQIEAVQGRANLEKLKMELFQIKVQAYTSQVQGKNSEWQGYTAAINGEEARVKIYASQVDAFQAQWQGYAAEANAKAKVIEAAATTNKARADQFTANMQGYQTVVQARGEKAKVQLENQRQVLISYQAQIQGQVANAQVASDYYKAVSMTGIANAELQMKAMLGEVESRRAYGQSIAQLGISSAQIYSNLASATMSGMNSLAAETVST